MHFRSGTNRLSIYGRGMPQLQGVPGGKWVLIEIPETAPQVKAKVNPNSFTHLIQKHKFVGKPLACEHILAYI